MFVPLAFSAFLLIMLPTALPRVFQSSSFQVRSSNMTSCDANTAVELSEEMKAILDDCGCPARFKEFCSKNDLITPSDLGAVCAEEKDIQSDMVDPTEFADIVFAEKKNIKKVWLAVRARMPKSIGSAPSAPAQAVPKKMPDGAENRLRTLWKTAHGIHLSGSWLTTESVMTQMFLGLHAMPQGIHVPDISNILRKSMLNQKPAKGTLITEHGFEQLDYTMSPCATNPELFSASGLSL